MGISSPSLPFTSDPALLEDWQQTEHSPITLPSSTYLDDLEAQRIVQQEFIEGKTQRGEVIQHRAWKVAEVFRSDLDHPTESPLRARTQEPLFAASSPPAVRMPSLISSPVAYPPSSSPPVLKRPLPTFTARTEKDNEDLTLSGIVGEERAAKRRMLYEDTLKSSTCVPAIGTSNEPTVLVSRKVGAFVDIDSDEEDCPRIGTQASSVPFLGSVSINQAALELDPPSIAVPSLFSHFVNRREVVTCNGKTLSIRPRKKVTPVSFEELVAEKSITKAGRAKRSYYGIDIQQLVSDAAQETKNKLSSAQSNPGAAIPSIEDTSQTKLKKSLLWTEKYRAKRFFDLVGDDRTHREVLRWLKGWDPIVFPGSAKAKPAQSKRPDGEPDEKPHRKILMLTGPPGLGKTTLAHVCAAQAGYEIMEINASDERSSNVVKGRIRTSVGTESVKNVGSSKKGGPAKTARPVCVVIDEVDGVVSGTGGSGEGGFIKALIDLIQLDAKNTSDSTTSNNSFSHKKKKGDNFRLLRPVILICNDVYHPSLRPLRQSSFAEVIHIRKPPLEAVVNRMKSVFEREGVLADNDAVRKLCEATWGMSTGPEARFESNGTGEGDIRSVLVVGEWAAGKLKSSSVAQPRMTRKWVEENMLGNLGQGGGGTRGVGRGGAKEVVSRVFVTGAGFPKPPVQPVNLRAKASTATDTGGPKTQLHANEIAKKLGMERLREMVDTSGETDRIVTDIFSTYPSHPFNDDSVLSKPTSAYEWLHFSDMCSSRVWSDQDFELMPYLSQPVLACHHLFATPAKHFHSFEQKQDKKWGNDDDDEKELPFSGPRAHYDAKEAEKASRAVLTELQGNLNPALLRAFRSPEDIATDLLPYLVRLLSPDVKPVVVGGSGDSRGIASVRKESEKHMVKRAVDVMGGVGVKYERGKLEAEFGSRTTQWVYRMEPPLDELSEFPTLSTTHTGNNTFAVPTRYAVRQVLDQEHAKDLIIRENAARQARFKAGALDGDESSYAFTVDPSGKAMMKKLLEAGDGEEVEKVKKDFFGRVLTEVDGNRGAGAGEEDGGKEVKRVKKVDKKVWVTFHEGFSNAVRKPVTVEELLRGL